jgi:hypothetical protein
MYAVIHWATSTIVWEFYLANGTKIDLPLHKAIQELADDLNNRLDRK